ncbi:ribosomal protein S3 [Methanococcus vannielii SB]|jgi:small subunit ribosomal protein S3|uniref:Small ribosomal subunit protein uS3 n=1 Tax=Methanococcus vannielii (strain ATCC 35089 / DSM 1224 / JCM 13029 / OCM 148 / SB) TaxID=406327 RepID=RS3_METVS|nr:30S ribosomal protein S3 [Methanococcus vannielii]A6UQ49.1 RecName: Full=Small ribosomal subunit protein uS3; AltName: Full=30S ribosomal protein S3 [Methanococcus vannielii SB]ABR54621.1 ribosomal protein S3 [Methanococcus vannielii SB]
MIERTFIAENVSETLIDEYFKGKLVRAGYSHLELKKTPIGTRITVFAEKPGFVIGRKGKMVKELTDTLTEVYKVENPQIEVKPLETPDLDPAIVGHKIAASLEKGMHFRKTAHSAVRRVMAAGAKGVAIIISGKLSGERSRTEKFMDGYMKHCGEPAEELVIKSHQLAKLKLGIVGVTVKIMRPDVSLPDEIIILSGEIKEVTEFSEVSQE